MQLKDGVQKFKWFGWILLAIGVSVVIGLYVRKGPVPLPSENDSTPSSYRFPRPGQEISGFHFDGSIEGRPVVSISARHFSIHKIKVGVFRFGLLKEAFLRNAEIVFYGIPEESDEQTKDGGASKAEGAKNIRFDGAFSQNGMFGLPAKNVARIKLAPVEMRLCEGKETLTKITAAQATIDLQKKALQFSGNVKAESGDRLLRTETAAFFPQKGLLQISSDYRLFTTNREIEGRNAAVDIKLKVIGHGEAI